MNPVIAKKSVTLSSGIGNVDLGFMPDHVEITNTGKISSIASGDTITVYGKPNDGSSPGQLVGLQATGTSAAGMKMIDAGNSVSLVSEDYYGISIASVAGFASDATLTVLAYRENG